MPNLPLDPKSRGRILRLAVPPLLATTSVAALLLAAPAQAGQTITTPQAAVTNPAGQATTSIVINGTTVTGTVTNAGTIMPGKAGVGFNGGAAALSITNSTVGGGIANTGSINATATVVNGFERATAISMNNSTLTGGIANSGTITSIFSGAVSFANDEVIDINNSAISGGIVNTGKIAVSIANTSAAGGGDATVITVQGGNFSGGVANAGMIAVADTSVGGSAFPIGIHLEAFGAQASGQSGGAFVGSVFSGDVVNHGIITVSATSNSPQGSVAPVGIGINVFSGGVPTANVLASGGSFTGSIVNSGMITTTASNIGSAEAFGIVVVISGGGGPPIIVPPGTPAPTLANSTSTGGVFTGSIVNNGIITVSAVGNNATGIAPSFGIEVHFFSPSALAGVTETQGTFAGSIINTGTIAVSAKGSGLGAVGIVVGQTVNHVVQTGVFTGAITNLGTITATGTGGASGVGVRVFNAIPGGITNTGMIAGSTSAIDLTQEIGGATVVTQSAGALVGSVLGSGNTNADVLNFTGGRIVLSPTQSISGIGTYTQTGGTLVLGVTPSTVAGTFASLSAGTINLRGGTLQLTPQGSLFGFAATQTYRNIIAADPPLSGSFASVTTTAPLFAVTLTPDPTTANALDATLALSQTALAASAQDLTQGAQLGLDAPRVLTQAVQDRLVASGGALGEGANAKGVAGFSFGNANIWARGADQFGSATASGTGVGYDINRAAPLIAGVDWRLDNGIVAGVAATYVATSAKFQDGSSTNVSSYQGAAYAGWAGGPWYALGSAVVSFNDFGTSRLLAPFGLPGDATSSPSGQSYQGHAEAGYHWGVPAAGMNVSVTPYAALDYVNAHLQGFSETGGFGALSVNAADANSFQTTLGLRLTSRIAMGTYGTLIPELRLGWNHEFLDASQKITASLVGVSGSSFSATGIAFGRDAALVGGGFSMELSPDAKVFVDYDGRLGSRVQEHSVSGGLKVRF